MTIKNSLSMTPTKATVGKSGSALATAFFTVGYEQSEPENFIRRLQDNGVEMIVDVRDMPLSRKRGFSKNQLQELLEEVDIDYLHVKPLGAPKEIRDPLRAGGSWWEYVKGYERVLRNQTAQIDALIKLSREKRICLLCFERNPAECHRSMVAREMERRAKEFPVQVEHILY
jgi:uncharacterized protein (DUF488 family)